MEKRLHGSWRKGISPTNFQIKCLVPCLYCGTEHPRRKRHILDGKRTFCNPSCQVKWQNKCTDFNKGKNNPSYVHGERVDGKLANYGPDFTSKLRRSIKIRDGYNCQKCFDNFSGKLGNKLDIHHIDCNKFNNDSSNLVTLCKVCHTKTHWELGKN